MAAMASSSISWRMSTAGKPSPVMCSLSRSPAPTARVTWRSVRVATVAAAWATIAGWYRPMGQVSPVARSSSEVAWATAPRTDQAKGLWSCSGSQGWMWSEMQANARPLASAATAWSTSSRAPRSSDISFSP